MKIWLTAILRRMHDLLGKSAQSDAVVRQLSRTIVDNYGLHRALLYNDVCRSVLYNTTNQVRAVLDTTEYDYDCSTAPELLQVERDNTSHSYYEVYLVLLQSVLQSTCN